MHTHVSRRDRQPEGRGGRGGPEEELHLGGNLEVFTQDSRAETLNTQTHSSCVLFYFKFSYPSCV